MVQRSVLNSSVFSKSHGHPPGKLREGHFIVTAIVITYDYIIFNGEAVEVEGELAPDGSTFVGALGVNVNSSGDYLTVWDTDAGNSILLLNSSEILLTEGDVLNLDFDGDGTNEDLVIDFFNFEDFDLADNGTVVLSADFNALDGSQVGDALISFSISDVPEPGSGIVVLLAGLFLMGRRRRVA